MLILISLRVTLPNVSEKQVYLQRKSAFPLSFVPLLWSCSILRLTCRNFLQTVLWPLIFTLTPYKVRLMRYDPVWTEVPVMFTWTRLAEEGHSHYSNKAADQGPALLDMLHSRRGAPPNHSVCPLTKCIIYLHSL